MPRNKEPPHPLQTILSAREQLIMTWHWLVRDVRFFVGGDRWVKKSLKSSKHDYKQELDFTVSFRKVTRYTGRVLSIRASHLQSKRARTTDEVIIVVDIINISACRVENTVRGV